MKRFNILFIAVAIAATASAQITSNANYSFIIKYEWGFIHETAGFGNISVSINDGELAGTLSGHSIPWGGRVYAVSDTLYANLTPAAENVSYINGWYRKPKIHSHIPETSPESFKTMLGQGELSASPETMEAVSVTADMLSMFYYAQALDFASMAEGEITNIPIQRPDGTVDRLKIVYNGPGQCSCGCNEETFDVTFTYSRAGEDCKYPASCQISQSSRQPTTISANIKIGHVEMVIH